MKRIIVSLILGLVVGLLIGFLKIVDGSITQSFFPSITGFAVAILSIGLFWVLDRVQDSKIRTKDTFSYLMGEVIGFGIWLLIEMMFIGSAVSFMTSWHITR